MGLTLTLTRKDASLLIAFTAFLSALLARVFGRLCVSCVTATSPPHLLPLKMLYITNVKSYCATRPPQSPDSGLCYK
jgi:hypothetical protein